MPVFCQSGGQDIELAEQMILEFENSLSNRESKGRLLQRMSELEERYKDYKLVRGFFTLLERISTFLPLYQSDDYNVDKPDVKNINYQLHDGQDLHNKETTQNNAVRTHYRNQDTPINDSRYENFYYAQLNPVKLRRAIFEESAKRGFALTETERNDIIRFCSLKLHIPQDITTKFMWSDLEENTILVRFEKIDPHVLVSWYNVAAVQTLIFNCTKMEFIVQGGRRWKEILRRVKKYGLMYSLEEASEKTLNDIKRNPEISSQNRSGNEVRKIKCTVDGPLSIFKMTDRYGTSMAKLIPEIFESNHWAIKATIIRKTLQGKKMYEFELDDQIAPKVARFQLPNNIAKRPLNIKEITGQKINAPFSIDYDNAFSNTNPAYDSKAEEQFARKFEQSKTGWQIQREPDPIILSDGKAMIADFMISKNNNVIYLEIVGFWTRDYLERKLAKVADILANLKSNTSQQTSGALIQGPQFTFFIALNRALECSSFENVVPLRNLIFYNKDDVPVKPILEHIKYIEDQISQRYATSKNLDITKVTEQAINGSDNKYIIQVSDIASLCKIPSKSVLKALLYKADSKKRIKIAQSFFYITDNFLYDEKKIKELVPVISGLQRYTDACEVLRTNGFPQEDYDTILKILGYEILWQSLDVNKTTIKKVSLNGHIL